MFSIKIHSGKEKKKEERVRSPSLVHTCNPISHYGPQGDLRGEVLRGKADQASRSDGSHPAGAELLTPTLFLMRQRKATFISDLSVWVIFF